MTFITSLVSVSSIATWIFLPLNAIFLTLDGIIYSLVAYSYKLFLLMAQMNFNVIYAWVGPLIDRVKALILVLILFKLGMSLIQYMINPDKVDDKSVGGAALIKNIAISAVLLVCYSFIFSLLNELSLLVIGVPEGYTFTTLNDLAGVTYDEADKNGLIARFIFGEESETTEDFGKYLSVATLQIFLRGKDGTTSQAEQLYNQMLSATSDDSDFNMMEIVSFVSEIDRSIQYTYPILSSAIGCYLIYSIVKIAIEIGVRMFKLIVLQILAPVAIISIIDGGFNNKIWKNYIDTFWKTYVDVFIRVFSMFMVTAFISKFWAEKTELFPEVNSFTRFLVMIIVIVAAYRFAALLPKFIDSIFGSKLFENNSKGLGNFLKAGAGAMFGGAAGLATGIASGAGALGTMRNIASGFGRGTIDGFNSKANNIAGYFKEGQKMTKSGMERGLGYSNTMVGGVGKRQNDRMGNFDKRNELLNKIDEAKVNEIKNQGMNTTDLLDMRGYGEDAGTIVQRSASQLYSEGFENVQLGENATDYASRLLDFDREYQSAQAQLVTAQNGGDAHEIATAQANLTATRQFSEKRAREYWEKRRNNASGTEVTKHSDEYNRLSGRTSGTHIDTASERKTIEAQKKNLEQSRSYQQHHKNSK